MPGRLAVVALITTTDAWIGASTLEEHRASERAEWSSAKCEIAIHFGQGRHLEIGHHLHLFFIAAFSLVLIVDCGVSSLRA